VTARGEQFVSRSTHQGGCSQAGKVVPGGELNVVTDRHWLQGWCYPGLMLIQLCSVFMALMHIAVLAVNSFGTPAELW